MIQRSWTREHETGLLQMHPNETEARLQELVDVLGDVAAQLVMFPIGGTDVVESEGESVGFRGRSVPQVTVFGEPVREVRLNRARV